MYRDSVDTEMHFYVPMYGLLSTYDSCVPSKKSLQVATPWVERPWPQGARLRYCGRRRRRARSASTSLASHLMSILWAFSGNYGIAEWYFMGYYQQQPDTGRVHWKMGKWWLTSTVDWMGYRIFSQTHFSQHHCWIPRKIPCLDKSEW